MGLTDRILEPARQARGLVESVVGRVVGGLWAPVPALLGTEPDGAAVHSAKLEEQIGGLSISVLHTVEDVVNRLAAVYQLARSSPHGDADGIACFTHLYHTITANVLQWLNEGKFKNSEFLATLDLEFAERYFQALRAYAFDRTATPTCWRVLFDNRSEGRISRLHFATVGVNAHINFDLAFSLISTCRRLDVELGAGDQLTDYRSINEIFAANTRTLRDEFEDEADPAFVDAVEQFIDDFAISLTREIAWEEAVRLWPHRLDTARMLAETRLVDERATVAGRAMLVNPFLR